MARTIYTEGDIEALARQGEHELVITDQVYLTDLARERAERLEIKLIQSNAPPASMGQGRGSRGASAEGISAAEREALVQKVKSGVLTRLGGGVDAGMVESIVRRVVKQL